MARHFLELDAATLETTCFRLAKRNARDVVASQGMGLFFGDAGLGKTYAVEAALERVDVEVAWFVFPLRTTPKALLAGLLGAITGIPHEGTQAQLERLLLETLSERERALSIDEAQRLNYACVEMLRHLHDQQTTRFALVLIGGNGCHDLILRYPMLSSRIARWTQFCPLTIDEVRAMMPEFHPLYERSDPVLLETVDDRYADGNLRNWANFTQAALGLARERELDHLTPEVVEMALALVNPNGVMP